MADAEDVDEDLRAGPSRFARIPCAVAVHIVVDRAADALAVAGWDDGTVTGVAGEIQLARAAGENGRAAGPLGDRGPAAEETVAIAEVGHGAPGGAVAGVDGSIGVVAGDDEIRSGAVRAPRDDLPIRLEVQAVVKRAGVGVGVRVGAGAGALQAENEVDVFLPEALAKAGEV